MKKLPPESVDEKIDEAIDICGGFIANSFGILCNCCVWVLGGSALYYDSDNEL